MEITRINRAAYEMLLSKDRKKLYFSSSRAVFEMCLDTLEILRKAHIANVARMIEIDSDTLFLINTTGQVFQWKSEAVHKVFKWKVPNWYEGSFYLLNERYLISESWTGIWRYDLTSGDYKRIFEITKDELTKICMVEENQICFLCYPKSREDQIHLYTIDEEGNIITHAVTPQLSTKWIGGASIDADGNWWIGINKRNNGPNQQIYCFGENGDTVTVLDEFAGHDSVDFITVDEDYLACVCLYETGKKRFGVLLIHTKTGEVLKEFDNEFLTKTVKDGINPPTVCQFLPGNRLAIGSWCRLWIFSYKEEEKASHMTGKTSTKQAPDFSKPFETSDESEKQPDSNHPKSSSDNKRKNPWEALLAAWKIDPPDSASEMDEDQAWKLIEAFDSDVQTGGIELFIEEHGILQLAAVREAFQTVGLCSFSELIESYAELMGTLPEADSGADCNGWADDEEEEWYDFCELYSELSEEETLEEKLLSFAEKHNLGSNKEVIDNE